MKSTFTLNTSSFAYDAQQLIDRLGADGLQLCREEMRLTLAEIRKRTPPFAGGQYGRTEKPAADQKQGQIAIKQDAQNVAWPMDLARIRNPRLRQLIAAGDDQALQAFFDNVQDGFLRRRRVITESGQLEALHVRSRNRRGRVPRDLRNAAFERHWHTYFSRVMARVGKAKALFNAAAMRLGLKTPDYIAKHGPRGTYAEQGGPRPFVEVSGTSYIPNMQARINEALRLRARRFESEVRRLLAGGKSRRASLANTSAGRSMREAA